MKIGRTPCECCGFLTLAQTGQYEVCAVCGWADDPFQREDPEWAGGVNPVSLAEARRNFAEFDLCQAGASGRAPRLGEIVLRNSPVVLRALAGAIVTGEIGVLAGCCKMAPFFWDFERGREWSEALSIFIEVESEAEYEARVRPEVLAACERLIALAREEAERYN